MNQYIKYIFLSVVLYSCVPAIKLEEQKDKNATLQSENEKCAEKLKQALQLNEDFNKQVIADAQQILKLQEDTLALAQRLYQITTLNKELNDLYEKVIAQNKDILNTSSLENQKLSIELANKQKELSQKEQQLSKLGASLTEKEANIDALNAGLKEREAKVTELENALKQKEAAANALKDKITEALLGFDQSSLSVEQRNGKVYVSISDKLLFKSGKTDVDPKGKEALGKLAEVLKSKSDINILIEGHTDNVPMIATERIKDNWELSVLRATSIVHILTRENNLDPKRVMAAGRGEFFPVADNSTTEGKAKNRRTEIILTPKLDELLKILEHN